jgi:hypothetical protein
MTLSGSSYDSNIINTPQPTVEQYESTAGRALPKLELGITKDTLVPFTDVSKQATWKYDTNANNPSLHSLNMVRMSGKDSPTDDQWKDFYESLLNTLPKDVQDKLAEMNKLPLEKRNPQFFPAFERYYAFELTLQTTAKAEAWLNTALKGADSENSINFTENNRALAGALADNFAAYGKEFVECAKDILKEDVNAPDYNSLNEALDQLSAGFKGLYES